MRFIIIAGVIGLTAELMQTINATSVRSSKFCEQANKRHALDEVVDTIVEEIASRSECILFVIDSYYKKNINFRWSERLERYIVPVYLMIIRESEDFTTPRKLAESIITESKHSGCDGYVILMSNPLQVLEFLRYSEKERSIDTRGSFLLIHDWRLFVENSKYLWNRITNVVFIRRLSTASKRRSGERINHEWFNLETVYYPVRVQTSVLTRYLDTWYRGNFRYGVDHFQSKTLNLERKSLKVAVFEHIPAVTRRAIKSIQLGNFVEKSIVNNDQSFGIEFELIKIIAKKMNFKPIFYTPPGIEDSKWGKSIENDSFDGLIGESLNGEAAFLIGDLHNTPRHNRLLDLSLQYNTECLTFLTPEALNDNSWKLLIVPFKLYTWIAVMMTLILGACIFHIFALTYRKYISSPEKTSHVNTNEKIRSTRDTGSQNLDIFTEPVNSIMYTYGMLLQISLPRIPTAWAVRVFIGFWWLYSILVTVAYRASMTATLANPISRVTIDTIVQLANSKIAVGGWTDEQKEIFLSSADLDIREIGKRFQVTSNEDASIARVADGTFSYYENIYVLKEAKAHRQQLEYEQRINVTNKNRIFHVDRDLHIMEECLIDMPISIGMDKNSPLKPQVDQTIRRIVEAGFIVKWLSDVTEWTNIVELRYKSPPEQTLVNLHKLHGALVALGIGYLCGFIAFIAEKLYWKYIIQRNPYYDKYQMDVFYARIQKRK